MYLSFNEYDDFTKEFEIYHMDKCNSCRGVCELEETNVSIDIDNYVLEFPELFVLKCKKMRKRVPPTIF